MNHTPSKPWYKHWWGVILAIFVWPIFLTWLVWSKTHWETVGKIAATAGIIVVVLWVCAELELLQVLHALSHNSRNLTIQSPAYKLAAYDLGHAPDASTVTQYQIALDALGRYNRMGAYCTESEEKLAGEVWTSLKNLRKNGVTDETNLTLLGGIKESIPVKRPDFQSQPVNCLGVLSAYLAVREPLIRQ